MRAVSNSLRQIELADQDRCVPERCLRPGHEVFVVAAEAPLEIVVGLLLIVGLLTRVAALVSALLFVAFIIGIASAWARGLQIDCGCFGGGGYAADATEKYPWEIARDVGLLALSLWLVVFPRTRLAADTLLFRRTPLLEESE